MNIKFAFTPEERQSILDGLEIVLDSLVDYEKSFLDFRDECPDECTDEEIDSIEVVFYKGSCDNIYVKTREYYENYKKRQALR